MSYTIKSTSPTEEQIRQRAYEIYLARGGENGRDLEDWIKAEREFSQSNLKQDVGTQKARSAVAGR